MCERKKKQTEKEKKKRERENKKERKKEERINLQGIEKIADTVNKEFRYTKRNPLYDIYIYLYNAIQYNTYIHTCMHTNILAFTPCFATAVGKSNISASFEQLLDNTDVEPEDG